MNLRPEPTLELLPCAAYSTPHGALLPVRGHLSRSLACRLILDETKELDSLTEVLGCGGSGGLVGKLALGFPVRRPQRKQSNLGGAFGWTEPTRLVSWETAK